MTRRPQQTLLNLSFFWLHRLLFAVVGWATILAALTWGSLARAVTSNEVVLVLDNSGSMGSPWRFQAGGQAKMMKPSDPERAAILGALILEALARQSSDRLTVIGFTAVESAAPPLLRTAEQIQGLPYNTGTFYRRPLAEAKRILAGAKKGEGQVMLFFTDGIPADRALSPDELPVLAGLDVNPDLDTFVIGLWSGESNDPVDAAFQRQARGFLTRLARVPEDLEFLTSARQVVPAFTRGYARALGSKPEVGKLRPGQTKAVEVGKYVVEVLVVTAASEPGLDYSARVTGPGGNVPARAGDNGCPPGVCSAPRRHFEAFRAENDPGKSSQWSLTIAGGQGEVDYGIILRYDFAATVAVKPVSSVGEQVPIEAQMAFQGKPFTDEAFFKADGFEAFATVAGARIPLQYRGGGKFVGAFTPAPEMKGSVVPVRATFKNTWLDLHADATTRVEGLLDLALRPTPNPIDLGAWKGERGLTTRCTKIDLAGSPGADRVEVTCKVDGAGGLRGMDVTCLPVAGSEAVLPSGLGRPLHWEVCAEAPRCPDDCLSDPGHPVASVTFAGKNPAYASGAVKIPVYYRVAGISWLACWWPALALVGAVLFGLWFIFGWVRPYNFEPALSIRLGGSEAGLKRTSALVLREQPGGVRGFYRNARVSINASGDFVRTPRLGVVVIEAGPGGSTVFKKATGVERKDRRTGKWEPLPAEELVHGIGPGLLYRTGELYFKAE